MDAIECQDYRSPAGPHPFTCVVADPDPATSQAVNGLLSRFETTEVHTYARFEHARALVETERVHLLVLPFVGYGGEDGLDFLTEARKTNPLLHVIVVSDEPSLGQVILSFQHGAVDFVPKPFDPLQELADAVAASISRWQRWSQLVRTVAKRTIQARHSGVG
ncbi:MAG: response regulator [Spirochaetota bacterium]